MAPEWAAVQRRLAAAAPQLAALQAAAKRGGNATAATERAAAELRQQLPVATRWDATTGQLLVGVVVTFPGLLVPRVLPTRGAAVAAVEQQQHARARRMTLQRETQHAGTAAVADWAPLLARRFGAQLSSSGRESAVVQVPVGRLADVLAWLAERPAVHWLSPAPKLRTNNRRVTSIAQVGRRWWGGKVVRGGGAAAGCSRSVWCTSKQALATWPATPPPSSPRARPDASRCPCRAMPQAGRPPSETASLLDPGFHPLWAAGLTGAGQVIGCGDSGIGARGSAGRRRQGCARGQAGGMLCWCAGRGSLQMPAPLPPTRPPDTARCPPHPTHPAHPTPPTPPTPPHPRHLPLLLLRPLRQPRQLHLPG